MGFQGTRGGVGFAALWASAAEGNAEWGVERQGSRDSW